MGVSLNCFGLDRCFLISRIRWLCAIVYNLWGSAACSSFSFCSSCASSCTESTVSIYV